MEEVSASISFCCSLVLRLLFPISAWLLLFSCLAIFRAYEQEETGTSYDNVFKFLERWMCFRTLTTLLFTLHAISKVKTASNQ